MTFKATWRPGFDFCRVCYRGDSRSQELSGVSPFPGVDREINRSYNGCSSERQIVRKATGRTTEWAWRAFLWQRFQSNAVVPLSSDQS